MSSEGTVNKICLETQQVKESWAEAVEPQFPHLKNIIHGTYLAGLIRCIYIYIYIYMTPSTKLGT